MRLRRRVFTLASPILCLIVADCSSHQSAHSGLLQPSNAGSAGANGLRGGPSSGAAGANASGFTFTRRGDPSQPLSVDYSMSACSGVSADPAATASLNTCEDVCGGAHCVDADMFGGPMAAVPDCPSAGGARPTKCIPDKMIELHLHYVLRACTFTLTGERGVCVPACLVPDAGAIWLDQDVCTAAELCAPCTDSLTGMPSATCKDRCGAQ